MIRTGRAAPVSLSRVRLAALAALAGLAVALAPAPARAASRVVMLRAGGDDALAEQATTLLVAELKAAGFDVVEAARDPRNELRADIEAASRRLDPVATFAIRAVPDGAAAELWLEDRVTGKLVIRRIDVGAGPDAPANLALKAVELLRGSLLEVTVERAPGASAPPAPPPADVARFVAAAGADPSLYFTRGWGVAAGASLLGSSGLDPALAPLVRLSWGSRGGIAVRLTASGLGSAPTVTAVEGTARIHQTVALAEGLRVLRPGARLQPFVGVAVGGYRVRGEGTGASVAFSGATGTNTVVALGVVGGGAARLGSRLALVLDAGLLLFYPRTRIVFDTQEITRAGGLALQTTLSLGSVF